MVYKVRGWSSRQILHVRNVVEFRSPLLTGHRVNFFSTDTSQIGHPELFHAIEPGNGLASIIFEHSRIIIRFWDVAHLPLP